MKLRILFGALGLGLALISSTAMADGVVRDGLGAISAGRGGTNLGFADAGSMLNDNPAAMVNMSGRTLFEFSADLLWTDLNYTDPQNNTRERFKTHALPHVAAIKRTEDGMWAFGIGAFAPAGFGAKWDQNTLPVLGGGVSEYRSLGLLAKILPGVAVRVTDRLSVGGTLGVGVSYTELSGPFFLQTGALAGAPADLRLHATGAQLVWSFGMQYQLTDRTTLGATFNSETRTRLEGEASAFLPALAQSSEFDSEVHLTWPRSVGVGFKHDFCCHRRIAMDVIWYNWEKAFDHVGLVLSNPSNPALAGVSPVRDQFPLQWRDSVSVRTGYEFAVRECDVARIGYVYHRNPIPSSTLTSYIPAILEHTFSVGYGTHWRDYRVDFAYQYSFGTTRYVDNSAILGGDFDNSSVAAQTHWALLTLSRMF